MVARILISIVTMSLFIIAMTTWFDIVLSNPSYFVLLPLIISLFHLTTASTFRLVGLYKYLSPMLLVNMPTNRRYQLHNGTSFDYLLNINRLREFGVKKVLLGDYLKGLLTIIEEIQTDKLPETVIISGSSYFFSERTANRFGFRVTGASIHEKLNTVLNYLDLLWMYSLSNNKLSFPDLKNMKSATIVGKELVEKRKFIEKLLNRIERTAATSK